MKMISFHLLWIILIGYLLGYYFRGLGDVTVGKLYRPAA